MKKINGIISLSETTKDLLYEAENLVAPSPAHPILIAELAKNKRLVVVTHSSKRATELIGELSALTEKVMEFPAWETLPHEKLSPNSDTVARRIKTIYNLDEAQIIIAPIRALVQPIITSINKFSILGLTRGDSLPFTELIRNLVERAYTRVDLVERRGDFAVRGGIIDIFPPDSDYPIRVDFFGDEIEEIKRFEIGSQRTFAPITEKVLLYPCRELLITDEVKARASDARSKYPELIAILNKVQEGSYADGMESLVGLLHPEVKEFLEFINEDFEVILLESERIRNRNLDLIKTSEEFLEAAWSSASSAEGMQAPLRNELQRAGYLKIEDVERSARKRGLNWRSLNLFGDVDDPVITQFDEVPPYRGDVERLIKDIRAWLSSGYLVALAFRGHGLTERYLQLLSEADIPARIVEDLSATPIRDAVYLLSSSYESGFEDKNNKVIFLAEADITGVRDRRAASGKLPSRRKKAIDPLELKRGDYVVHEIHGVGRYQELLKRSVGGVEREYVVIEYAPSKRGQPADRIFVPTDSLELVTRYVGGETPALHRIGGSDWIKAKSRAKKAVKEIAGELIRLYAARTSLPGYAFSADTTWQRELEDSFEYVETPDQLVSINEVKADMERPYPMDRIVCGDVGYGKTEIAVRAAFKAVQDAKQVAVLVPTTLLVQQHLATFAERYAGFPLKVSALSRFNTAKEISETLAGLTNGTVDVVIGTHRLLSEDVKFRDLGLIIVDEEQRFGVEHKEKLKKLRTTVDVLSMSATPIPRTLEMAITGIREMSTIATPPEERHPVLTYVGAYEEKQVAAAIHRELLRDGQVFYIHNRVESIEEVAAKLRTLVPEARVAIAHGQMNESALEQVVLAFWNREFDVLVCTTIVENGIDVANANTLIVDRADKFGLSQLHQLRGRVGRSRERAYAYFLYSGDKPLTEIAMERLTTIARNSELGSGMQVALKDLEIRGAGNLLGGEQSGHIAEVGFDLYMRMVGEAVNEFKRGIVDGATEEFECKVEIPITAHLSTDYVPSDRLRLDLYRRLADAHGDLEVDAIQEELQDRFGALPEEAVRLLEIAKLRIRVKQFGIRDLAMQGKYLKIAPIKLSESRELRISRLYPGSIVKSVTNVLLVARPTTAAWQKRDYVEAGEIGDTSLLEWVSEVIAEVTGSTRPKPDRNLNQKEE
ncbi:MAG: transcription-repair coupling factor [Actinobacteria bacterium]|nr:transcription-repair coupling factor [Actinomycetota bacterium]